jgi:hypothetical protein
MKIKKTFDEFCVKGLFEIILAAQLHSILIQTKLADRNTYR